MKTIRGRILEVATEVFSEYSYREIALFYIAKKASVTEGSIHVIFGSKDTMLNLLNTILVTELCREVSAPGFAKWIAAETVDGRKHAHAMKLALFKWCFSIPTECSNPMLRKTFEYAEGRQQIYRVLVEFADNNC